MWLRIRESLPLRPELRLFLLNLVLPLSGSPATGDGAGTRISGLRDIGSSRSRGRAGYLAIGSAEGTTGFGSPATGDKQENSRTAVYLTSNVSSWPSLRLKGMTFPSISIVYSPGGRGMELAMLLTPPTSFPSFVLMT